MKPRIITAIKELVGGRVSGKTDSYEPHLWDGQVLPSKADIDVKFKELMDAYPMQLVREERNRRIAETDWWASSDIVMNNERQIYRKSLRDLPSTASPKLDVNDKLINVTWPTKPE